jgi:hypothetical protein
VSDDRRFVVARSGAARVIAAWRIGAPFTAVWASSIFTLIAIALVYLGQSSDAVTSQKEQTVQHAQAR